MQKNVRQMKWYLFANNKLHYQLTFIRKKEKRRKKKKKKKNLNYNFSTKGVYCLNVDEALYSSGNTLVVTKKSRHSFVSF